jgi:NADP-dependent 3-hydroxy acid dehydrogenase YdfG
MIDVNIKGVLYGIAAALPHMQAQKSGHIINVSSVAGHKVGPGGVVYAATKHAVRVISEGLRQEVKPYNVRTTIISPGAVATELTQTITDPVVAEGMRSTYERAILPSSFASMVAFAISQPDDVDVNPLPADKPSLLIGEEQPCRMSSSSSMPANRSSGRRASPTK